AEELGRRQRALAQAQAALRQQVGVPPGGVVWQLDPAAPPSLAWHIAEIERLQLAVAEPLRAVTEALWHEIPRLQQALAQEQKQHAAGVEELALARSRGDIEVRELRSQVGALRQQLTENISLHGGLPAPALPQSPGQPPAGSSPAAADPA